MAGRKKEAGATPGGRLQGELKKRGPFDSLEQEAAQLLQGEALSEELIDSAAEAASGTEISPFGNIHASVEYQRHLAKVLTKRALKIAIQRAAEER